MDAGGGDVTKVIQPPFTVLHPAWVPDGARIAFTSYDGWELEIYMVNADGTGLVHLTRGRGVDHTPARSPDGSRIVFASDRESSRAT